LKTNIIRGLHFGKISLHSRNLYERYNFVTNFVQYDIIVFTYTALVSNLLMACSSLQDESDIPNTEDSDENLNGVPVMKKKDITPLDLLHGLNLDNM